MNKVVLEGKVIGVMECQGAYIYTLELENTAQIDCVSLEGDFGYWIGLTIHVEGEINNFDSGYPLVNGKRFSVVARG